MKAKKAIKKQCRRGPNGYNICIHKEYDGTFWGEIVHGNERIDYVNEDSYGAAFDSAWKLANKYPSVERMATL